MLTTLRISGFAIVDAVEVRFGPGLNVLTGETGAGKSILVNALHLVLGGRMSADVLREGAEEAVVEALFELPAGHPVLEKLGAVLPELSGETVELLVRRVAARGGRGRAFVNGALCAELDMKMFRELNKYPGRMILGGSENQVSPFRGLIRGASGLGSAGSGGAGSSSQRSSVR